MFDGDPKKPQPLTQSFGSEGEKLSFCSEPIIENLQKTYWRKKKTQTLNRRTDTEMEKLWFGSKLGIHGWFLFVIFF